MKYARHYLLTLLLFTLSACGGGDGDNAETPKKEVPPITVETSTISGVAQLGLISDGTAKLFKLQDRALLSETKTSSDSANFGAFSFKNIELKDQEYYLIEISGGMDTDPNDDGIVIIEEMIEVKGKVRAIVTGAQLAKNTVRVTALSDLQATFISTELNTFDKITSSLLDETANRLLQDINNDGSITSADILLFNPLEHISALKVSYPDIVKGHVNNIHNNLSYSKILYDLVTLIPPVISVEKGLFQKTPFSFNVSLKNRPIGLEEKWFIDGIAFDPTISREITNSGNKLLEVQLFNGEELLKSITTILTAHTTELLKEESIVPDIGGEITLSDKAITPTLIGTNITIPEGAISQVELISIHESSSTVIPSTGELISPIVTFEPAGLVFEKPVSIGIPVYSDIPDINDVKIVRTDENGVVDYLTPLRFDEDSGIIYFETEHFSSYAVINKQVKDALTDGYGDPLLTSIVDDIKIRFPDDYKTIKQSHWLSYLSTEIASIDNISLTVFDAYQSMLEAENINKRILCNDKTPSDCAYKTSTILDMPYRGYTAAFEAMFGKKAIPKGGVISEWNFAKKMINAPFSTLLGEAEKQYFSDKTLTAAYLGFKSANSTLTNAQDSIANAEDKLKDVFQNRFPIDISEGNIIKKILSLYLSQSLTIGNNIISASTDVKINQQISTYFQLRDTYSADALLDKLNNNEAIDGIDIESGWFLSQKPSGEVPNNFWQQIEALYINSLSFKGDSNSLKLKRDVKLKALLDAAINLHNTKKPDNGYFIDSYQVDNGSVIEHGKYSYNAIEASTQPNSDFVIYFYLQVEGDDDFVNSFTPTFSIDSKADGLYGLEHHTFSAENMSDGIQKIGVRFKAPNNKKDYEYEIDFIYNQSIFTSLVNDGKKFIITVENKNIPPSIDLSTAQQTTFSLDELDNGLVEVDILANDIDGQISSYRWVLSSKEATEYAVLNQQKLKFIAPTVVTTEVITAKVFVTDNDGAVSTKTIELTIKPKNIPPYADSGENQYLFLGENVTLNANNSRDEDGEISQYQWFQNGEVLSQSASFTIEKLPLGIYKYTLKITDSSGDIDVDGITVVIYDNESDLDQDGMLDAWEVDNRLNPSIDDSNDGFDLNGRTPLQRFLDHIATQVTPTANAGIDQTITSGLTVTLDGSQSIPGEGSTSQLTYLWEQIDVGNPRVTLNNTKIAKPTFSAPNVTSEITLMLKLVVHNGNTNQSVDVVHITIKPKIVQTTPLFTSLSPINVVSGTSSVSFTIVGENLPQTLAVSLKGSDTCEKVNVVDSTKATITCGIPITNENTLPFYIKDKTGTEGGDIISGAESLTINISSNDGNGFKHPCQNCGYSGAFDREWFGDNTTHLAQDYPGYFGDNIIAIARGRVIKVISDQAGFGGLIEHLQSDGSINIEYLPGPAIVVMHTKNSGENFYALYGHVDAINGLAVGSNVAAGEVLGTVGHYYVTKSGKSQADWPHLHFGIWDSETEFPRVKLGYGDIRSFVNPVPFLINTLPEILSNVINLTPTQAVSGQQSTFTITGDNLPSTIAMSLAGSQSCGKIYEQTSTRAKIDCIPLTTGQQTFYINNKSGGVFLPNSNNLTVLITEDSTSNSVLGVNFIDENFALCVQEHVDTQQVTTLADLTMLDCNNRQIVNVDELSNMTGLTELYLQNNQIVNINLDANQSLNSVNILNTRLSQSSLDYLSTVDWIQTLKFLPPPPKLDDSDPFITTWRVNSNDNITIGTNNSYIYDYRVDWGDGSTVTIEDGDASHTYSQSGDYTVKIFGTFPAISQASSDELSRKSIISINQWGNIHWKSMNNAFALCENVTLKTNTPPNLTEVTDISHIFNHALRFTGDLSNWNVSNITDMTGMFYGAESFTSDLSNWNVSNVTAMSYMFHSATNFTSDLSNWDVVNVIDIWSMFQYARSFTSDLSSWNVSNITNMYAMFWGASSFKSDLSTWDVGKVTSMENMFYNTEIFTSDLSRWNVSNVTNMAGMFYQALAFTSDLSNWDVSNVTDMRYMFREAPTFTSDLSRWNVSSVTNMDNIFSFASTFNSDLSTWDVSSVTNMSSMFSYATLFESDLSAWNVNNVTNMDNMFVLAENFTSDLSSWNVRKVLTHIAFSVNSGLIVEPNWP